MAIADEIDQLRHYAKPETLPCAFGKPLGNADLRCRPDDFFVVEHSGLLPSGSGEHLLLRIRKTGQNTRWVARELAHMLAVPYRSVSYAGMKDRHAVTEQWFSVQLPGRSPAQLVPDAQQGFEVLETVRHNRKIRPGQLSYNFFRLRLRNLRTDDQPGLEQRLHQAMKSGVPNFFGPQRFGHQQANLSLATSLTELQALDRGRRGFALSALRGALFNGYLAKRVRDGSWLTAMADEQLVSDRPRGVAESDTSVFAPTRLPSGLLWGGAAKSAQPQQSEAELDFYSAFPAVTSLLCDAGSRASRRPLVSRLGTLSWSLQTELLELKFALGPGCYATVVLRELLAVNDRALAAVTEHEENYVNGS